MTNELTGEWAVRVPGQEYRSIEVSKIAYQFPSGWMTRQSPRWRLGRSAFSSRWVPRAAMRWARHRARPGRTRKDQ
jgi:hypothetical protein